MYTVKVRAHFNSAHNLRGYKGKCEALHGHNWYVEVSAESEELDELGMVVDFKVLKSALKEVVSELDHTYLNELEYFKEVNPTSENLSRYIFDKMTRAGNKYKISSVSVWETDTASATYKR